MLGIYCLKLRRGGASTARPPIERRFNRSVPVPWIPWPVSSLYGERGRSYERGWPVMKSRHEEEVQEHEATRTCKRWPLLLKTLTWKLPWRPFYQKNALKASLCGQPDFALLQTDFGESLVSLCCSTTQASLIVPLWINVIDRQFLQSPSKLFCCNGLSIIASFFCPVWALCQMDTDYLLSQNKYFPEFYIHQESFLACWQNSTVKPVLVYHSPPENWPFDFDFDKVMSQMLLFSSSVSVLSLFFFLPVVRFQKTATCR